MRRPLLIAAVLLCLPLFASAADLSVKLTFGQFPVTPVAVGDSLFWDADVRNVFGPAAQNVTVTFRPTPELQLDPINFFPTCSGNPIIRCTFATLSPGQSVSLRISGKAVAAGFGELIAVAEEDGLNDPNPSDNFASSIIEIKSNPRLSVFCYPQQFLFLAEPNTEAVATCEFSNTGLDDGHDVTVTIEPTGDATFAGPPIGHQSNCTVDPGSNRIVCVTPLLRRCCGGSSVDLRVRAPDKTSGQFGVRAVLTSSDVPFRDALIQSSQTWSLPLSFVVTNTDDDGGGSLRQAIRDANAACNSNPLPLECLVSFHIPSSLASGGVFTIRPRTPLPELTGAGIVVGGDSQRLFAGDSNPKGPEIEINGSGLGASAGFTLTSGQTLRELTINGFPGPGVAIAGGGFSRGDSVAVINCYIGTDSGGMQAVPNERGIVVNLHAFIGPSTIANNVISGNRSSGIFISSPTESVSINGNVIGAGADRVTPLGNGASGIYTADLVQNFGQGEIDDNLIAYNKQWGIAIANGSSANMHRNRFVANGYPGIDHGFDLSIAISGADASRYPNAPLLVAAHYDPVSGNTIIAGHLEAQAEAGLVGENYSLELFASDDASDFPQAQRFLQLGFVDPGDFTVNVPGDLTGQWLTGTISRHRFYTFTDPEGFPELGSYEETSDLGPPLKVSQ
ncbi:MAG TPA: right-handed parallel beta-helix repeat-containing protein [Thermoanaerobaculia bacterium]|jgi:hypothetical protein|nr:right-handed parallel beta-helix repeat-containing protein [Thermoanaerobaculia bacterium]